MEKVLLYFSLKYKGDWDKIYNALDKKEKIPHQDLEGINSKVKSNYITILNPLYPKYLKNVFKPPFVLFYKGDISLINHFHKTIGLVGGETVSDYDNKQIETLTKGLNKEDRIISTFNEIGANEIILNNSLALKNRIILILNGGIKEFIDESQSRYDKLQLTNHVVITEIYEIEKTSDSNVEESTFRLLSGLSKGLLFFPYNSSEKLKNLISISLNDGKEIFAIPENNKKNSGTNKLIKQGAKLVENVHDILNEI